MPETAVFEKLRYLNFTSDCAPTFFIIIISFMRPDFNMADWASWRLYSSLYTAIVIFNIYLNFSFVIRTSSLSSRQPESSLCNCKEFVWPGQIEDYMCTCLTGVHRALRGEELAVYMLLLLLC